MSEYTTTAGYRPSAFGAVTSMRMGWPSAGTRTLSVVTTMMGLLFSRRRRVDDPVSIRCNELLERGDLLAQLDAALRVAHADGAVVFPQHLDLRDDVRAAV